MQSVYSIGIIALIVSILAGQEFAVSEVHLSAIKSLTGPYNVHVVPGQLLNRVKQSIGAVAGSNPGYFDPKDLENFNTDHGSTSAARFLAQREGNSRRAARLARDALRWRREMGLAHMDASMFPCDLFQLGLIFEHGRAHQVQLNGPPVETNPVIWIRLGALGRIIKQLERSHLYRVASLPWRAKKYAVNSAVESFRGRRRRGHKMARTRNEKFAWKGIHKQRAQQRRLERRQKGMELVSGMSVRDDETMRHIMRAIAWWLDDWVQRNPDSQATLVLDFEDTDLVFGSCTFGQFLVKLDDMFPNLFAQIIGFRYRGKFGKYETPINMLNRIFKSRILSSVETDRKLTFVRSEPDIGMYMPRVDSLGFTMLPEHVSGYCVGPDANKAPANCAESTEDDNGLYDPTFWNAIHEEFYYVCKPKPR